MELKAALYMRSSKDRNDVSIAAQRRSLQEFAISLNATIVAEFADPVESGRDYYRPGFQKMMTELKSPTRAWNTILMVDTARLARARFIGDTFKYQVQKLGVEVRYKTVPEVDSVSKILLEAVFSAMDEIYSLTAREKGIAGQVENINNGYRAGGRAPTGYRLQKIDTGAVRDGQPVYKTKLVPDENALAAAKYLRARAAGNARGLALRGSGLNVSKSTAISMDWNALTYAGHTVYGMFAKFFNGAPTNGKRKPREQWKIQENTHAALITHEEAMKIMRLMETSSMSKAVSRGKAAASRYLLSGIMYTRDGRQWTGYMQKNKHSYRVKPDGNHRGRYLPGAEIEEAVITQIREDITSKEFADAMIESSRKAMEKGEDPKKLQKVKNGLASIQKKITRFIELAGEMDDPHEVLVKIRELQKEKAAHLEEIEKIEGICRQKEALDQISGDEILAILSDRLQEMQESKGLKLKQFITTLVDKITLDDVKLTLQITYKLSSKDSLLMASPRGSVQWDMIGRSKPRKIQYFP